MRYSSAHMTAYARLRLPDGTTATLAPGEIVGRLRSAALHLHDARISEAHALLSLRGLELKLLALRGRFAVDGKVMDEVALEPGMSIEFAPGLEVDVLDVIVPDTVLAVRGDDLPRQLLSGVSSLRLLPRPRLVGRYVGDADAWIWSIGGTWALRIGSGPVQPLEPDDSFEVGGVRFEAISVPVKDLGKEATHDGGLRPPLHIEARFDSVQVQRPNHPTFAIGGIGARILSELVAFGGPVHWQVIAQEVWKDEEDAQVLRTRWDVALLRLRRKLKEARLPPDLVRADRSGYLELVLETHDVVVDSM